MAQDLFGSASASDGTHLYVFGGYSFTAVQTVTTVQRYNPVTNSWTTLAPLPVGSIVAAAVYYPPTNKIYVFGGSDRDAQLVFDTTRIYDIATNTWSLGATMPGPRSQMSKGYNAANGKIYLNGGFATAFIDSIQATTWEYDPIANTFTDRAPSPHAYGGAASGIIDGHLYIAGGRTFPDALLNLTADYNIATNTWQARANLPTAKNVSGSAVAQGLLWSIGGGNPFRSAPFTTVEVDTFDPSHEHLDTRSGTQHRAFVHSRCDGRSTTSLPRVGALARRPRSPAWRSSSWRGRHLRHRLRHRLHRHHLRRHLHRRHRHLRRLRRHPPPPPPPPPPGILYDQYDNAGTNGTSSQNFEAAHDAVRQRAGGRLRRSGRTRLERQRRRCRRRLLQRARPGDDVQRQLLPRTQPDYRERSSRPARTRRTPVPQATQ